MYPAVQDLDEAEQLPGRCRCFGAPTNHSRQTEVTQHARLKPPFQPVSFTFLFFTPFSPSPSSSEYADGQEDLYCLDHGLSLDQMMKGSRVQGSDWTAGIIFKSSIITTIMIYLLNGVLILMFHLQVETFFFFLNIFLFFRDDMN